MKEVLNLENQIKSIHDNSSNFKSFLASTIKLLDSKVDSFDISNNYEEILKNEAKFKAVYSSEIKGIIFFNIKGEIEDANDTAYKILGYTSDELLRKDARLFQESIQLNGKPYPIEEFPSLVTLKTGKSVSNVEFGIHDKFGYLKWLLANSIPVYNDQKNQIGALLYFRDTTNKIIQIQQFEEEKSQLQFSKMSLNHAQKLAQIGNWIFNIKRNSLSMSDELIRILELNDTDYKEEIESLIFSKIHPADLSEFIKRTNSIKNAKPVSPLEFRIMLRDGSIRILKSMVNEFILNQNRQPSFILGIIVDITDQKRLERELENSNNKIIEEKN